MMRLLEEEKVYEIVERITNEAVEKKQPKYMIQKRIIAELSGLPVFTIENDEPTIEEEALPLQVVTSEYMLQGYLVSDDYFECPSCSYKFGKTEDVVKKVHLLELFLELNFCPKCGQKLMRNDNGDLCYKKG